MTNDERIKRLIAEGKQHEAEGLEIAKDLRKEGFLELAVLVESLVDDIEEITYELENENNG